MQVFIPYKHWFTVEAWCLHNYITAADITHTHVGDLVAITFKQSAHWASFCWAWGHIICVDN